MASAVSSTATFNGAVQAASASPPSSNATSAFPASAPPHDASQVWRQPATSPTRPSSTTSAAWIPAHGNEIAGSADTNRPLALRQTESWTATTHTVHRSDGTSTEQLYATPAFRNTPAGWQAVDATVSPQSDAAHPFAAPNALVPIRFGGTASDLVELDTGHGVVTVSVRGLHLAAPQLDGQQVKYRDAVAGVTLVYAVSTQGLEESIVLDGPKAPRSFAFHYADPKGALGATSPDHGGVRFSRQAGDGVDVRLAEPLAYEQPASAQSPPLIAPGSAHLELQNAGGGFDATVSLDSTWLAGKTFPIVIDPTVQLGPWAVIDSFGPTTDCGTCPVSTYEDPNLVVGTDQAHAWRSWVKFDVSTIPTGASVSSASLGMYRWACLDGGPCAPSPAVEVHPLTTVWDYNTTIQSMLNATGSTALTSGYAGDGNTGETQTYDVTGQVQQWVNGSAAPDGFSLQLAQESLYEGGHYYYSSRSTPGPALTVTYTGGTTGGGGGGPQQSGPAPSTVAEGSGFALAIAAGGTVYGWGENTYGQLGNGNTSPASPNPTQVSGLSNIIGVAAGTYHSLFLRSDGTVWSSGDNRWGELGNGTITDSSVPVQVSGLSSIVDVFAFGETSAAIDSSGRLYTWGDDYVDILGHSAGNACSANTGWGCSTTPALVVYASGAQAGPYVSVSLETDTTFAVKQDGTVEGWGENTEDQLGSGPPTTNQLALNPPFSMVANPVPVVGVSNVTAVTTGYAPVDNIAIPGTVALEADGSLWSWGRDLWPPAPIPPAWAPATAVGITGDGGQTLYVLLDSGDVWALGSGVPQVNPALVGTPATAGSIGALSMGGAAQMAANQGEWGANIVVGTPSGTVWTAGVNSAGQLGNGQVGGTSTFGRNAVGTFSSPASARYGCPQPPGIARQVSATASNGAATVTWMPAQSGGPVSAYTLMLSPSGMQATAGGLAPWATGGAQTARRVTAPAHSGSFSALLGNTALEQAVTGDSTIEQAVTVPAGRPQLTFWYDPTTTEPTTSTLDWQEAEVRAPDGHVLGTVLHTLSNSGVWTPSVPFDLSPWAGQQVVLWFNAHHGDSHGPTAMAVDDVGITGGAAADPTQSGNFESASTVVSGLNNGQTYTAAVMGTNCLAPGLVSAPSGSFVPHGLPIFSKITQPGPNPTVSVGNAINYVLTVKNPEATGTMLVEDIQDTLPGDVNSAGTQVQVSGQACNPSTVPSCVLNGNVLQIRALQLQPGQQVTIAYSVIASGIDGACAVTSNVATLTTSLGSEQVSAPATICDTGLGLEKWWSYENLPTGPLGTLSVNVANGNLVLAQTDSTPIQAHGHLAYVLRRYYNSEQNPSLSFSGGLGAGWQLAVDAGDVDGFTPNAIYIPTAQQVSQPLGLSIIDSDGTRHLFSPRALTATVPVVAAGTPSATAGTLAPVTLKPDSGYDTVTVDEVFDAPPGVHLSMWRYIESSSTCTPVACVLVPRVIGYAAERPDRVRYEFAADGRLLDIMDGSGVELRYAYTGSPALLQAVYEPRSCSLSQALSPSTSHCRAFLFSYAAQQTTVTDPAGRSTVYHFDTLVPKHLTSVDNPDGTHLTYTYGGCGGSADQLCSAKDPRGSTTSFTYASSTPGLPRVAAVTDRKGTQHTFTYGVNLNDGTTTTDVDTGAERHVYTEIDGRGRVGEALQGSEASGTFTAYRDIQYTWDSVNACNQPAPIEDNLLCKTVQRSETLPPADRVTAYLYNQEGQLLRARRTLTTVPGTDTGVTFLDTTYGYHAQYEEAGASPKTYDDTVGPGGTVTSAGPATGGGRVDPQTVFVLSDRTQSLTPNGNAAGSAYQQYLTVYKLDDDSAVSPNVVPLTPNGAGVCASGVPSQNTGDLCEVDAPANAGAQPSVTEYSYDSFGQRITSLTPDAVSTGSAAPYRYVYYPDGALDLSGNVSAGGWLQAVVDPTLHDVQFAYDRAGNVARTWDRNVSPPASLSTLGVVTLTAAGGSFHATSFGSLSAPWRYVTTDTDPLGNTTTVQPDANGNTVAITTARGDKTTQGFDPDDALTCRLAPAEAGTSSCSSWTTGQTQPATPAGATGNVYDAFGNLTQITDPNGHVSTSQYDPVNRQVQTSWTQASTTFSSTVAYDGGDSVTATQDGAKVTTTFTYDLAGRRLTESIPRTTTTALVTQWVYDADSNVTDACPPNQNASAVPLCTPAAVFGTHSAYDPADHVITTRTYQVPSTTPNVAPTSANTATTTDAYDADGNLVRIVDANGHATTRTYDVLDRKVAENRQRDAATLTDTEWQYDASGNATTVTVDTVAPTATAAGVLGATVTTYSYDADNRLVDSVQGSTGANLAATGDANVRTRRYYDQDGHLTALLLPGAFQSSVASPDTTYMQRWDYDPDGRLSAQYVPRYGAESGTTDLGNGFSPQSTTQTAQCGTTAAPQSGPNPPAWPAGTGVCVTQYQYLSGGQVKQVTQPTGAVDTYAYLEDNLLSSATSPSATGSGTSTMSYQYDGDGRQTSAQDALSHTTTTTYYGDGLPMTVTVSGTSPHVTSYTYDANGNRISETDPRGFSSTTGYLSDNLVSSSADGAGDLTSYAYDLAGNRISVFSPSANAHDANNPSGTPTVYAYTFDNLLQAVTQPVSPDGSLRRETAYTYDLAGRKTSQHVASVNAGGQVESDGGTQNFTYGAAGRVSAETTLTGGGISWTYDPAGSATAVSDTVDGSSTVGSTYYLDETPRTVDDGSHTTSFAYDGLGSAATQQEQLDGTSTKYVTTYSYNGAELPSSMTSAAAQGGTTSWTYDADGNPAQQTDPNGEKIAWSFNADNEPTSRTLSNSTGGTLATWSYGWNADEQKTSEGYSGPGPAAIQGTTTYQYDAAGRLSSVQLPGAAAFPVTYDHDGNRTSYVNPNDPQHRAQTWTYNADDSILAYTDATNNAHAFTYYPFGGLQSDGCASNTYDALYRLTGVSASPASVGTCPTVTAQTYAYDGLDRQRAAGGTTVHYSGLGSRPVAESTAGVDTVYELTPAGKPDAYTVESGSPATQYLVDDGFGNVTTTTTTAQAVACTVRYGPYGEPLDPQASSPCASGSTQDDLFFKGARRDPSTGDYQFGSRTYDPSKAAFLTPDSYRNAQPAADLSVGVDPLTENRYSYVNGDPVNLSDPDGHGVECNLGPDCQEMQAAPPPTGSSAPNLAAGIAAQHAPGYVGGRTAPWEAAGASHNPPPNKQDLFAYHAFWQNADNNGWADAPVAADYSTSVQLICVHYQGENEACGSVEPMTPSTRNLCTYVTMNGGACSPLATLHGGPGEATPDSPATLAVADNLAQYSIDHPVLRQWTEAQLDAGISLTLSILGEGVLSAGAKVIGWGVNVLRGGRAGSAAADTALATAPDQAVFWSGIGQNGAGRASAWAAEHGGATLEDTVQARGIKLPAWNPDDAASVAAWRQVSQDFARGARGNIRVLQGDQLGIHSVWGEVEWQTLISNPAVRSITAINPESGAETLLWGG